MAVKEVTMYTIECDNCNSSLGDRSDYCAWTDEITAYDEADRQEWHFGDGKDYCPDCYTYDDDDNLIIKTKKQVK